MGAVSIARWQFAIVTVYHYFFVPLTLGLSIAVAIMETQYVRTGDEKYKKMTKFWGKLFLINFAIGVATGIVQEFQFGMNWSQYSRFMGDIFGAPLAIEALLAFFMESTFLGMWIFGWEKLPKKLHAATIWLVAIGSNLSAFWILTANSFMQHPVGYELVNGRAQMTDFFALITNPHVWLQFPHVITAAWSTAGFFLIGISAYKLLTSDKHKDIFTYSLKFGAVYGAIGVILVILIGHEQAQNMVKEQPMKMAAAEALWNSEDPAAMSLFTIGNETDRKDVFAIHIPDMLSFLAYNKLSGKVKGINQIEAEYEKKYGPGNYVPSVIISYWTFRLMVGSGFLMLFIVLYIIFKMFKNDLNLSKNILKILFLSLFLPYIANSTGWIFTEMGRQPWVVFGLMKTNAAVSNTVSAGEVWFSTIAYTLLYAALMVATVSLWKKYVKLGITDSDEENNLTINEA